MDDIPVPPSSVDPPTPGVTPSPPAQGRSIWKVIVLIVVILALLVSGYFVYQRFFKGSVDSVGPGIEENADGENESESSFLIPPGLEEYAVGEDAQVFILVRTNSEITDALGGFDLPLDIEAFESALLLGKREEGSREDLALALQFDSEESAKSAEELINSQPNLIGENISIDGKVVTLSTERGFEAFNGSFYDNPLLDEIPGDRLDDQFIMVADTIAVPDANISTLIWRSMMMGRPLIMHVEEDPSFFPTAHAAGLLDAGDNPEIIDLDEQEARDKLLRTLNMLAYCKTSAVFINLKDGTMHIALTNELMSADELEDYFETLGDFTEEDLGFIEEEVNAIEENIPDIQDVIKDEFDLPEEVEVSVELDGLTFSLSFVIEMEPLIHSFQEQLPQKTVDQDKDKKEKVLR